MTARPYATPLAFKQALEQRLRSSSVTGVDFARRRQLLVSDRFLARLVQVAGADLAWKTLPEVMEAVETFLNPVLDSAECGTWEPSNWLWKRRV